jgi:hypothetical protein
LVNLDKINFVGRDLFFCQFTILLNLCPISSIAARVISSSPSSSSAFGASPSSARAAVTRAPAGCRRSAAISARIRAGSALAAAISADVGGWDPGSIFFFALRWAATWHRVEQKRASARFASNPWPQFSQI